MASFEEQKDKATRVKANIVNKALFDFVRSIEKDLVKLNQDQLHLKSKDIYNEAIGFYSYATEVITKGRKKKGEPFDAKDTGSLLDKMYAKIENDRIVFGSTDSKVDEILNSDNWLSKDLFGLTDKDLQKVIDDRFRPFILEFYKKELGI